MPPCILFVQILPKWLVNTNDVINIHVECIVMPPNVLGDRLASWLDILSVEFLHSL
jgi:hypothetical protein